MNGPWWLKILTLHRTIQLVSSSCLNKYIIKYVDRYTLLFAGEIVTCGSLALWAAIAAARTTLKKSSGPCGPLDFFLCSCKQCVRLVFTLLSSYNISAAASKMMNALGHWCQTAVYAQGLWGMLACGPTWNVYMTLLIRLTSCILSFPSKVADFRLIPDWHNCTSCIVNIE